MPVRGLRARPASSSCHGLPAYALEGEQSSSGVESSALIGVIAAVPAPAVGPHTRACATGLLLSVGGLGGFGIGIVSYNVEWMESIDSPS